MANVKKIEIRYKELVSIKRKGRVARMWQKLKKQRSRKDFTIRTAL